MINPEIESEETGQVVMVEKDKKTASNVHKNKNTEKWGRKTCTEYWNKHENKEKVWYRQGSWKVKANKRGIQKEIYPNSKVQKMVILEYRWR